MSESPSDRVAKNEALFRAVNDRVRELGDETALVSDTIDFLCECGNGDCLQAIAMRADEYELVRANPVHFVVAHGHEKPDVERVVAESDGFVVIEKHPDEQDIARSTDPRA